MDETSDIERFLVPTNLILLAPIVKGWEDSDSLYRYFKEPLSTIYIQRVVFYGASDDQYEYIDNKWDGAKTDTSDRGEIEFIRIDFPNYPEDIEKDYKAFSIRDFLEYVTVSPGLKNFMTTFDYPWAPDYSWDINKVEDKELICELLLASVTAITKVQQLLKINQS